MAWNFDRLMELLDKLCKKNPNHSNITVLRKDWRFLWTLWECICHQQQPNNRALALKVEIEAAAQNIAEDIAEKHDRSELVVLVLVRDCQGKTKDFMAQISRYVYRFSESFQVNSLSLSRDDSFWTRFVDAVRANLSSIKSTTHIYEIARNRSEVDQKLGALYKDLDSLQDYILAVVRREYRTNGIQDFLVHVASVICRIAIQSCDYWINYKAGKEKYSGLLQLDRLVEEEEGGVLYEIDPANPKFMDFHTKTLIVLYKIHPGPIGDNFCNYLLGGSRSRQKNLEAEIKVLIFLLFHNGLEEEEEEEEEVNGKSREDVRGFLAEINAVLVEAACLCEAVRRGTEVSCPPCSDLLTKISILKVEHFLKKLLRDTSDTALSFLFKSHRIGELKDILEKVRRFSEDLPDEKKEYGKRRLAIIEGVAEEVASLCQAFEARKIPESTVKNSLLQLLLKMVISKAESFLMELLSKKSAAMKNSRLHLLLEQLNFFTLIVTNDLVKGRKNGTMILADIEALGRWLTCFASSVMVKKKPILSFYELLDKVKFVKEELKEIGPQFPLSAFPQTYKLGFIDFLFNNLSELLKYNSQSIAQVKHHIEEVQLHLKSLSSFLTRISDSDIDEHPELKDLGDRATNVAYKLEYVIDSIELDPHWKHFFWFYYLLDEVRVLDKQASQVHEMISDAKVQNATQVSAINEFVVDLSDEEAFIVDRLTGGSLQLGVVSIVGIPGIGKTTMARKLFNNQNVIYHFHRRAWCTVSQVYDTRELLLEIFSGIHGLTNEIHQLSKAELKSKLRQCLMKNNYLIVMDDVWDVEAWSDLKNSFPDNIDGSRILITSCRSDVALQIEPDCDPHFLRPFSDYESWKLLEEKVFQGEGCPQELLLVGEQIAQQCKGLPLSVVIVAGLLEMTEKRKEWWENVAESLSSDKTEDLEARCLKILELSYRYLPGYLKACFLYLAVFIEDRDIPVDKLIKFWIAEGLVQRIQSNNLEDVAQDYLKDLISRSLMTISKRRSNGDVKACRLHDRLHDLCLSKAKEENFLQLVTTYDEPYASFPSSNYGFDLYFDHQLQPVTYEAYRLSIFLKRNHFVQIRPSGLGTRSLIFFASTDSEPRCPYDISFICYNFKFLQVLDLECINMGISFPFEIGLLVGLRY